MNKPKIAIVGGGWAGLAAAVELCQHGHQVSLFESAPQLGGRARSVTWNNMTLDNGQHLMLGAYQQMLQCLTTLHADTDKLFKRLPYRMLMLDAQTGQTAFDLQLPTYPAPLHLLFGIFNTPSLSFKEKITLLIRFNQCLNSPIKDDLSVTDWLQSANLPLTYTKNCLEPVCLAALTTHPHQASAKAFQRVLQQTFSGPAHFTDLLIPTADLSQIYPNLAKQFILKNGGDIQTRSKVQQLHIENNRIQSIVVNDQTLTFDQVILATPASITHKLLDPIPLLQPLVKQINQLKYEPVTTLYLQFKQATPLPYPMLGIVNGLSEWVFERSISGNNDVLAVVISARGKHCQIPEAQLVETIYTELSTIIPNLSPLLTSKLITDKRATFQCHPNIDSLRPCTETMVSNLKLCGDYVYIEEKKQAGLPSTLEGALHSGVKCAQSIIRPTLI
ncbi:Phytoene desaturase, pro-zeta-carotene producing [hydrothermal vent metagenome]|uniref:Phytoene desaturase, pro-zeta-carotene producing n=1 Tax=hydrothermal vent metagenome TaxID=652676 RepID=A0A3B0WY36_9ZZZZ